MSQPEAAYLNTPRVIKFEDQDYTINLIDGIVKAEFERLMLARVTARIADQYKRGVLSRSEYQQELRIVGQREDAGEFSFERSSEALTTMWCQKMVFQLLMPTCPKDVFERLFTQRIDELQYHLVHIMEESFREVRKANKEVGEKLNPFVVTQGEQQPTS